MADLPILYSGPMVRALIAGTKSQTRRICRLPAPTGPIIEMARVATDPKNNRAVYEMRDAGGKHVAIRAGKHRMTSQYLAPYAPGDRLYVREAWHAARSLDSTPPRDVPRDADIEYAATARSYAEIGLKGKFRQGMHMPRWASRLTLTVTDVRVQRLQEISAEDARDEGVDRRSKMVRQMWLFGADQAERDRIFLMACPWEYEQLWDSLNATRGFGWSTNPWVVATSFTTARGNIDGLGGADV